MRTLHASGHLYPDGRPHRGARVHASLVLLATGKAVDAWVVATGQRVAGAASTQADAEGTWSLALWPNDAIATRDGGATAWLIQVTGFAALVVQLPSGAGAAELIDLVATGPLAPAEILTWLAHVDDEVRHLPGAGIDDLALIYQIAKL